MTRGYHRNIRHAKPRRGPQAPPGNTDGFPKIWEYYGCPSSGAPLVTSTGVFDSSLVSKLAKHDLVTLNTAPFLNKGTPNNLGIVTELRARNPHIKILWYDQATNHFQNLSPGTVMTGDEWSLARGLAPYAGTDRTLYYDSGHGGLSFPANDNGLNGTYTDMGPIASQWLAIWEDYAVGSGADGIFFDFYTTSMGFPAGVDFGAAGYSTRADLETSIGNGLTTVTNGMMAHGMVFGNRGDANLTSDAIAHLMTGELFELWDHGNASAPGQGASGFASMDAAMTKAFFWQGPTPTSNGTILLKAEEETFSFAGDYDSTTWRRACRKTAACAAIAGGYSYVSNNRNAHELDTLRWADEYWVDRSTGVADSNAVNSANRGWLGRPTEYGYKDSTSGIYVRHFDNGVVLMNGQGFNASITLERPYKRLLGTHDPFVNDGSTVTTILVPSADGRFLLRI